MTTNTDLHVEELGDGDVLLLVHSSVRSGWMCWEPQRPLSAGWRLRVVARRGCFPNPPDGGEDYERDTDDVSDLLPERAHLVGHSYGGLVSLLVAARHPERVASLTVIEPPAFGLARTNPAAARFMDEVDRFWDQAPVDPSAFLAGFLSLVGSSLRLPDPLPEPLAQNATALRLCRRPWRAQVPLEAVRAAGIPTLVVSGGHHAAFEAVCDVIAGALDAERLVLPGAGHTVPDVGQPFNDHLERFLRQAARRAGAAPA